MIEGKAFLGLPLDFKGICKVYPPKIKDIIEKPNLLSVYSILIQTQEDIQDDIEEKTGKKTDNPPTPFGQLMASCFINNDFRAIIENGLKDFIQEDVVIFPEDGKIFIGSQKDLLATDDLTKIRLIDESLFFDFQNALRESMGEKIIKQKDEDEDPILAKVEEAARKRKRKIAKIKSKSKSTTSFTTILGGICCMGIGITPLNIGEISYAAINLIKDLYQQKEKYDIDIRSIIAGADPKKVKPKYWIQENDE